ncbi:MAG: DUF58 domain-containing protein [Oscillospiraceae bacterium]|nr:DUF58 domain-containing protein [Oscillospiraceae bacterium]
MPILHLLGYLLLAGLAWLFRASYVGWLGPYIFAAAVLLPLVILLFSLPSMMGLQVTLSAPGRVMRKNPAELTVDFSNRRLLPIHSLTLHIEIRNRYTGERSRQNYIFRNLESSQSRLPLPTDLCGELECAVLRFECRDALGIFSVRRRGNSVCSCTVMPQAVESDEPINFEAALSTETILKPKYGGGFAEDHDLRSYRPGDTANSIHWKLTSKMDEPIVREALVPENSTIFVVLSRVGEEDRGLEVLRWLSRTLLDMDEPHVIVSDSLYSVGNEEETDSAIASTLSWPMREPCGFDAKGARCVFTVSGGEVRWQ